MPVNAHLGARSILFLAVTSLPQDWPSCRVRKSCTSRGAPAWRAAVPSRTKRREATVTLRLLLLLPSSVPSPVSMSAPSWSRLDQLCCCERGSCLCCDRCLCSRYCWRRSWTEVIRRHVVHICTPCGYVFYMACVQPVALLAVAVACRLRMPHGVHTSHNFRRT